MKRITLAMLFATAAAAVQAQDRNTFTVGTATAARGQKATGTIEVPAGSDAALSIPVAVFHGAKPGPVLALVASSVTTPTLLDCGLAGLNPPVRLWPPLNCSSVPVTD